MHLTNSTGQTVSLLNDAENVRSGTTSAAAGGVAGRQWTATVISGKPGISQQRPTLPSSSLDSSKTAISRRNNNRDRENSNSSSSSISGGSISRNSLGAQAEAGYTTATTNNPTRPSSTTATSTPTKPALFRSSTSTGTPNLNGANHTTSTISTTLRSSNLTLSSSLSSPPPPENNHPTLTRPQPHPRSALINSATSATSTHHHHIQQHQSTSSTSLHSIPHSSQSPYSPTNRPKRPSLSTDLRYLLSPSSESIPTTGPVAASSSNSRKGSTTISSLPCHTTQQSSSATALHTTAAAASSSSISNSSTSPTSQKTRPRLTHHEPYSRKSSYASQLSHSSSYYDVTADSSSSQSDYDSPVFSPDAREPKLQRLDSASSSARSLQTPSPMTPSFPLDLLDPNNNKQQQHASYMPGDVYMRPLAPNGPYYNNPPIMPTHPQQQQRMSMTSPLVPQLQPQPSLMSPAGASPAYNFTPTGYPVDENGFAMTPTAIPLAYPGVTTDLIAPSPITNIASSSSPSNPHASPASSTAATASNNSSNPSQQKAKKKYPCPHAARFACTDTFTTSGHAARHGKKHTGEKNILCPTCNKAFTRKDNMKQHERTHRNNNSTGSAGGNSNSNNSGNNCNSGRRESVAASVDDSEDTAVTATSASAKRSKTSSTSASSTALAFTAAATDMAPTTSTALATSSIPFSPMLPLSAGVNTFPILDADLMDGGPSPDTLMGMDGTAEMNYGVFADMVGPKSGMVMMQRPANERKISEGGQSIVSVDGEGESPGLDALAMAASEMS